MKKQLIFHEKHIDITLTKTAGQQCTQLNSKLIIEIQIYFSCLLGKRLAFYTEQTMKGTWTVDGELFQAMLEDSQQLHGNVYVRFNTVMTKGCPVSDYVGPPPVTDFKINNQKPYVPNWLDLDCKNGVWRGEYGWAVSKHGALNTKQIRAGSLRA